MVFTNFKPFLYQKSDCDILKRTTITICSNKSTTLIFCPCRGAGAGGFSRPSCDHLPRFWCFWDGSPVSPHLVPLIHMKVEIAGVFRGGLFGLSVWLKSNFVWWTLSEGNVWTSLFSRWHLSRTILDKCEQKNLQLALEQQRNQPN